MLTIDFFLRHHWGSLENLPLVDKYFSIDDKNSVRELFEISPSRRYNYGKVIFEYGKRVFLSEECELDFFISTIQFDKEKIFSGKVYKTDNSYFQLSFHYHDKLIIEFESKKISVRKEEFIHAFRIIVEKYYLTLAEFHTNGSDYREMARLLLIEWQ